MTLGGMTAVPFTEIMKTFKLSINQKLIRPKVNVLFGYCNCGCCKAQAAQLTDTRGKQCLACPTP